MKQKHRMQLCTAIGKRILLTLFMGILSVSLLGQAREIKGKVTDDKGTPLPFINVMVKGTTMGAQTNEDGSYTISIPSNVETPVLIFSSIGFNQLEQSVGNRTIVDVSLESEMNRLEEIVVVGFGTQKKENLTGAVSSVNVAKAIGNAPIPNVVKGLQGVTPGLTITYGSGNLGSAANISIRGAGTVIDGKESGSPLILVDGIPSDMSLINPEDIATLSVLKDAASASIYGARAAFGVILITTKTGKATDKVVISYSNNFAFNNPTKLVDFSDPEKELPAMIGAAKRQGQVAEAFGMNFETLLDGVKKWKANYANNRTSNEMVYGEDWEIIDKRMYFYRVWDPHKEMLSEWTPQQTHNIAAQGRMGQKSSFMVSLGIMDQTGLMKIQSENLTRYNANLSLTTELTNWLQADFRVVMARQSFEYPYNYYDGSGYNRSGANGYFGYYMRWGSYFPYGTYKGSYFRHAPGFMAAANTNKEQTDYLRWNANLHATITKDLQLVSEYALSTTNMDHKLNGGTVDLWDFWSALPSNDIKDLKLSGIVPTGDPHDRVAQARSQDLTQVFNTYMNFTKRLNDSHNFKAMLGTNIEWNRFSRNYSERRTLLDRNKPEFNLAIGQQFSTTNAAYDKLVPRETHYAIAGMFMRLNYDYLGKYLLELNGRYDGSSRFPSHSRWAFFPSASAGYRISEESFMATVKNVLTDAKVRASIGSIGNQNIAANAFLPMMNSSTANWITNGVLTPTVDAPKLVDPELSWERVVTYNVGADFRFFGNLFGLTVDWFQRNTSGMLAVEKALPHSFGADAPNTNAGNLRTRGYEINLDFNHSITKDVSVYANLIFSDYQSVVTKWNNPSKTLGTFYEGMKLGEIWGLQTDRLYQEKDFDPSGQLVAGLPDQRALRTGVFEFGPGDVMYKDLDGNTKIDAGNRTVNNSGDLRVIGNSMPRFQYALRLGGYFYGFDLDIFFQGVGKRDFWADSDLILPLYNRTDALYEDQLNYWTPENTTAFFPNPYAGHASSALAGGTKGSNNFVTQTRYMLDMSYLRLKNITLGYTLPNTITQKVQMEKVRVFFSGQNLLTFASSRLPVDPEINETEANWGRTFPFLKTVSFGLQVNF